MEEFQIVNGSQLLNHIGQAVSLTGYVNNVQVGALTFEIRATDNVMVKIILKEPLSNSIYGYVEVQGRYQNKAITAEKLIAFNNTDMDVEGHNFLSNLLHSIPNIWNTVNAAV